MPRPALKVTVIRTEEIDGGIVLQLFINVDQRWGGADAMGDTEAKPVCLTVIVIPGCEMKRDVAKIFELVRSG